MSHRVLEFQPTPNPNALKCILDAPLPEPIRSFRKPEEAAGDPLGSRLLAIPGVSSVLLSGGWMTVNKAPAANWPAVKKAVQDVLKDA
jgi:NFU1 iron-sulfur cluster scaffold homolog, mitochondrial